MNPSPTPQPVLIEMVGGGSFWDSQLFISILTLTGVVIGALLGFFFSWILERSKAKRAADTRWHQDIRELTAEILRLANEHIDSHHKLTPAGPSKSANPDLVAAYVKTLRELQSKSNELSLIGSYPVGQACGHFVSLVLHSTDDDLSVETREESAEGVHVSRAALMKEVRQQLGLPEGF